MYVDPNGHWWDWFWNNLWGGIQSFFSNNVAKWIVGGIAFAGSLVLTAITGGAMLPVVLGMAGSILSSGLIEGTITAINGGNFWDGFVNGMADGTLWGEIFALGGATISFAKNLSLVKSRGVVIGKGMERVGFVADQAALSKYSPMKGYNLIRGSGKSTWRVNLADRLSVAHNKAWINRVMRLKKPIYDIGLGKVVEKGAWYGMELKQVANYFNYFIF